MGQYLSIVTYTKGGKEIPTPVWFVAAPEKVYVATPKTTYKIRRIKNEPGVQIAPCSRNGKVLGSYVKGIAKLMPIEEYPVIYSLFRKKYGILFKIWSGTIKNLFRKESRKEMKLAFIEITPKN